MGARDMFDIPTVLSSDEILDKAFRKASKVDYEGRTKLDTVREINISKVKSISDIIVTTMGRYVKAFPSLEKLSPFYSELVDMSIGRDRLKKSLGAMDWCRGSVARVSKAAIREMGKTTSIARIDEIRRGTYGRVSSFVKQVGKELDFLAEARKTMKRFPTIDPSIPTVVVAGAPNVGKSQLVGGISTAKPRGVPLHDAGDNGGLVRAQVPEVSGHRHPRDPRPPARGEEPHRAEGDPRAEAPIAASALHLGPN
jgi:nucleolar GTP-binding protein